MSVAKTIKTISMQENHQAGPTDRPPVRSRVTKHKASALLVSSRKIVHYGCRATWKKPKKFLPQAAEGKRQKVEGKRQKAEGKRQKAKGVTTCCDFCIYCTYRSPPLVTYRRNSLA